MTAKPCADHSGHCARLDALEENSKDTQKSLDELKKTMNRWGGMFLGVAAVPLIIKIFEILTPAAHAIGAP